MDKYNRKAVFSLLKPYDFTANAPDFIEVTEWANGDGFDVDIMGKLPERVQMTWGTFKALKKCVKELEKHEG